MSLTINMVGAGDPDKSGIILNNSQVKPNVAYGFVSVGTAALNASPFDGVSLNGLANSVQYSYIRLGPVDLTGISSISAEITATAPSGASSRAVLFVSQSDSDRSYNGTATAAVETATGTNERAALSLGTSSLSGAYYVYAGCDSGGSSWQVKRDATVYGVKLNKAT